LKDLRFECENGFEICQSPTVPDANTMLKCFVHTLMVATVNHHLFHHSCIAMCSILFHYMGWWPCHRNTDDQALPWLLAPARHKANYYVNQQ